MWNPLSLCGFRLQFAESTYNLRIPLTFCGFRFQFADSTYICGFQESLNLLSTYIIVCLWTPQKVPDSATLLQNPQNCLFFERFHLIQCLSYLLWNPKQQRRSKKGNNVVNPQQIWFWPVPESAYDAQKAQFGLVMIDFKMKQLI